MFLYASLHRRLSKVVTLTIFRVLDSFPWYFRSPQPDTVQVVFAVMGTVFRAIDRKNLWCAWTGSCNWKAKRIKKINHRHFDHSYMDNCNVILWRSSPVPRINYQTPGGSDVRCRIVPETIQVSTHNSYVTCGLCDLAPEKDLKGVVASKFLQILTVDSPDNAWQ